MLVSLSAICCFSFSCKTVLHSYFGLRGPYRKTLILCGQTTPQKQKSYLKDTAYFTNFIEKTKVSQDTFLVSMDVTNLYTNISQEDGITKVRKAYEKFHNHNPSIPSRYLKDMRDVIFLKRILSSSAETIFSRPMVPQWLPKWQRFASIFMTCIEGDIVSQSNTKPREWKRYIDDIFSLWDSNKHEINLFI